MTVPLDDLIIDGDGDSRPPLIPGFDVVFDPFFKTFSHITWKESVPASLARSVNLYVIKCLCSASASPSIIKATVIDYLSNLVEARVLKCFANNGRKLPRFIWRFDFSAELRPGDQVLTLDGAVAFPLDDAGKIFRNPIAMTFDQRDKLKQRGHALGVFLGVQSDALGTMYAIVFVLNRPMVYSVWDLSVVDAPKGWIDPSFVR